MRGPVGRLRNRVVRLDRPRTFCSPRPNGATTTARAELGLPAARAIRARRVRSRRTSICTAPSRRSTTRRERCRPHMHWVGALRPDPPTDWPRPDVVGRGPVARDEARGAGLSGQHPARPRPSWSSRPFARLADAGVLVVVTTGRADPVDLERAYVDPLPANVRVAKFVPYDQLLPHVSVLRHQRRLHRRHACPASRRPARPGRHHRGEGRDRRSDRTGPGSA